MPSDQEPATDACTLLARARAMHAESLAFSGPADISVLLWIADTGSEILLLEEEIRELEG